MTEILFLAGFAILLFAIFKSCDTSPAAISQILEETKILNRKLQQETNIKSRYRCRLIIPIYMDGKHIGEFSKTIRTTRPPQIGSIISGAVFIDAHGNKFEPNSLDDEKLFEDGAQESDTWQFGPITEVIDHYQEDLFLCHVQDHHVGGESGNEENLEKWKRFFVEKGWEYGESFTSMLKHILRRQE